MGARKGGSGKGRQKVNRAIALGTAVDAQTRINFLRALVERGHAEAAQRETDLLWRVSDPNSYYSGEALRRLAIAAAARKDYAKAAECSEQSMLRCLRRYIYFAHPGAFAGVPAQVHQFRARS